MEGALFIGEDLQTLRSSLIAAEQEAEAMNRLIEKLADDLGVCLTHSTLRRECGCREEEK